MTVDKVNGGKSGIKKNKIQNNTKNNQITSSSPALVQITTTSDASGLIMADPKHTLATTSMIPSSPIGLSFISSPICCNLKAFDVAHL